MRVNEIFESLQGEGRWTGKAAVFLRLSGCNISCPFCDTAHDGYVDMSVDEILSAVSPFPSRHIVITGGEPALQLEAGLLRALKTEGFYIQIETNGTIDLPNEALGLIDWITCSPKDAPVKIRRMDELKVVYQGSGQDMAGFESMAHDFGALPYLQPCDMGDGVLNARITASAIAYVKAHPQWTLSLQTHKLLNIR